MKVRVKATNEHIARMTMLNHIGIEQIKGLMVLFFGGNFSILGSMLANFGSSVVYMIIGLSMMGIGVWKLMKSDKLIKNFKTNNLLPNEEWMIE